jgi:hypothetical protein
MKAGRLTLSTRKFATTEISIPNLPAGYVRIPVKAAGVCLSDVHFISGITNPGYLDGDVVTLGHEVSGVQTLRSLKPDCSSRNQQISLLKRRRSFPMQSQLPGLRLRLQRRFKKVGQPLSLESVALEFMRFNS